MRSHPARAFVVAALSLGLLSAPTGCKKQQADAGEGDKKKAKSGDEGDDDPGKPRKKSEAEEDLALGDKLNGYIKDCLNVFSKPIRDSDGRYYEWVDPKTGPTGKERFIRGLYEVTLDPERCAKTVKTANELAPRNADLEKAADGYVASIKAVIPLTKDAFRYYDKKEYAGDGMKKGKELHGKLAAAFDGFDKADKALSAAVDSLQEGLNLRDLARLEKEEGKKTRWHSKNTVLLAKAVLKESVADPTKIDVARLDAATEALGKAVDEFDAWASKNKDAASPASSYLGNAKELVIASRALVRRLQKKEAYTATEKSWLGTGSGWMVNGSPDQLLNRYNQMIGAYNSIHF